MQNTSTSTSINGKSMTCGQVYKALEDSINLRWKRILALCNDEEDGLQIPDCQLCNLLDSARIEGCGPCPLSLIGQECGTPSSAWKKYCYPKAYSTTQIQAVENMISTLEEAKTKFFGHWTEEDKIEAMKSASK